MKILVTGGAGFIGSHITDALITAGHTVTVVDDLSSGYKKNLNPQARFEKIDVRDPNISTLFEKSRFDAVFHLAAQIDVRKSVHDPFFDASVNILGTLRLLECCRTYGVKKFIFTSSGGVMYGECTDRAAREEDESRPISPYGFSKLAAERYVRFYGENYNLPYAILRYANVYGPRQDPHGEAGVVAIFSGKVLAKQPATIFGTGNQQRDYVYVRDVAAANLAALTGPDNKLFNISTALPTSVNELYARLSNLGGSLHPVTSAPARTGELDRSVLDFSRAKKELNWSPSVSLDEGLTLTLDYFRHAE
jgi:UDP-glucose 4-epimerase